MEVSEKPERAQRASEEMLRAFLEAEQSGVDGVYWGHIAKLL